MAGNPGIDLYSSKEIAEKVENIGIVKANLPLRTMFMPGILANTFTGFGALHFHAGRERHLARFRGDAGIRRTGFPARPDPGRGGRAELFTGHNFLLMARAEGDLPFALLARNWPIVYMANARVCLAVWLATAGCSVTDKVLAIVFPVSALVAAGFEHCVANMYFIPMGMWPRRTVPVVTPAVRCGVRPACPVA